MGIPLKFAAALALGLVAGAASAKSVTSVYEASSAVGSGSDHSLWISTGLGAGIGSDFDFDSGATMTFYDDGTAELDGHATSQTTATAGFEVLFNYDTTFVAGGDEFSQNFKSENGSQAVAGQTFYRDLESGTLTGTGDLAGLDLLVTRKPADGFYATQIGPSNGSANGANNKNTNFGMANWFEITVVNADCDVCAQNDVIASLNGVQGDINIDLSLVPVPLPATGLLLIGAFGGLAGLSRRRRKAA